MRRSCTPYQSALPSLQATEPDWLPAGSPTHPPTLDGERLGCGAPCQRGLPGLTVLCDQAQVALLLQQHAKMQKNGPRQQEDVKGEASVSLISDEGAAVKLGGSYM